MKFNRGKNFAPNDSLNGGDASAELAKDKGFAKDKQKKKEESIEFYGAGYENMDLASKGKGSSHHNHEQRKSRVGADAFFGKGIDSVGRRFALNSTSSNRFLSLGGIDDIQAFFRREGISDAKSLFAETAEMESGRFLSQQNEMTNEAIKMDNYEFFVNNSYYIKMNLAKTLLAKIDLDRDLKGTLADLLETDGKWNNDLDPVVVFEELKNRLRNAGLMHHKEYDVILKTFKYIEDVEAEHKAYKMKRQKTAISSLDTFDKKMNDLIGGGEDKVSQDKTLELLNEIFENDENITLPSDLEDKEDDTMVSYLRKRIAHLEEVSSKDDRLTPLYALHSKLMDDNTLANKNAKNLKIDLKSFEESRRGFITEHNQSLSVATEILNRFNYRSKHYPVTSLARWTDEEYLMENFAEPDGRSQISIANIDESMTRAIKDVLGDRADLTEKKIENIKQNLKESLSKNKASIENIYNPEKDTANPQRPYQPFEAQHYHEDAHNVLRDALYLSIFKEGLFATKSDDGEVKSVYDEFYDEDSEKEIITSVLNKDTQDLRPDINKVTDLHNIISAINKTASAQIDDKSFDALIDSPLFKDNQLYDKEDLEAIRSYGKDLSRVSEQMKDKDIYGTPEDQELKDSIKEMIYIENANNEISKLRNSRIGNLFLQNNKALRNLEVCMEGARNPTTTMETVPSLSKACFEKLKDEYEQQQKETNATLSNPQTAMAGLTFVGALVMLSSIHSASEKDRIDRLIAKMNFEIAEESAYVENSVDRLQKSARMLNIGAEKLGISSQIVKEGFKDKLIDEAELEHTVRDIVKNADNSLPQDIILNNRKKLEEIIEREVAKGDPDIVKAREELIRDKSSLERLQEEVHRKQLDHFILQEEAQEVSILKESIIEQEGIIRKEANGGDVNKMMEARVKLEKTKANLKQIQDDIIERAKEQENPEFLKRDTALAQEMLDRIKKNEALVKEGKIKNRELLNSLYGRIKDTSFGGAVAFSLEGVELNDENDYPTRKSSAKERNILISIFGKYRDNTNEKALNLDDNPLTDKELDDLKKESLRIDSILPRLHREALADSYNVADTLKGEIYDSFHFEVSDEVIENVRENGLSDENIVNIMEEAEKINGSKSLSSHKKNNLYISLYEIQKSQKMLHPKSGAIRADAGSNLLSNLLKKFNNPHGNGLGKRIQDSNNFYATTSVSMDGNAYVSSAKGILGMFLYQLEDAERKEDYKRINSLAKKLELMQASGYIPNEQKEELLARINRHSNDISLGNETLLQQTLKSNRRARVANARSSRDERKMQSRGV